jgi:ribosomal protein S12 methylthiotransferase accessory factor
VTTARRAAAELDPLVGLVRDCFELPTDPDDPRIFCFISEAARPERYGTGTAPCPPFGCGTGLTPEAARGAAIGEVVERYAAGQYDADLLVRAPHRDVEREAVPPEAFATFSPRQHRTFAAERARSGRGGFESFTRDTLVAWVHGWRLGTGERVLVPAAFVFLPYRYGPTEAIIADGTTTGLACGRTVEEALLGALCEVVERDAVSIAWLNRLSLPTIEPEGEMARVFEERFACRGVRYRLLDATLDLPLATVLAVLTDERGGSAVGAATRPDPEKALLKALLEVGQCRTAWKRDMVTGSPHRYAPDFSDVVSFADHARVYTRPGMHRHLEFLWSSDHESPPSALPSQTRGSTGRDLARCIELLRAAGLDPIAFDLTPDDVAEAGFTVVRVVIPGMQPLQARHDAPCLGGRRLYEAPVRAGRLARSRSEALLNRTVHPFP